MNECARIASLLAGWVDDLLGDRVASFAEIAAREARPYETSACWRRSPSPHHGSSPRSSTAPARPISRLPGWQKHCPTPGPSRNVNLDCRVRDTTRGGESAPNEGRTPYQRESRRHCGS